MASAAASIAEDAREYIGRHFQEAVASGKTSARVFIEKRPSDGQYFISTQIGDVIAKTPIEPLDKRSWDRKMIKPVADEQQQQSSRTWETAPSSHPHPVRIEGFADIFMDFNDLAQIYGHAQFNSAEQRRSYELQRLGPFAAPSRVAQVVWCFPVVPPAEVRYYNMLPDEREWPVMVKAPSGTLYPDDFRLGVARFWRASKHGHKHDVFLVQKPRYEELQPENDKYYGPAGSSQPFFQVPGWMIGHWRPMMVKEISFQNDTVLFLRRGGDPVRATVNEVRPNRTRSFASLDAAHQQMAVAMLDLYYEYPEQMRAFYDPSQEVATQEYSRSREPNDNSDSERELRPSDEVAAQPAVPGDTPEQEANAPAASNAEPALVNESLGELPQPEKPTERRQGSSYPLTALKRR